LAGGSLVPTAAGQPFVDLLAGGTDRELARVPVRGPHLPAEGDHRGAGDSRRGDLLLLHVVRVAVAVTGRGLLADLFPLQDVGSRPGGQALGLLRLGGRGGLAHGPSVRSLTACCCLDRPTHPSRALRSGPAAASVWELPAPTRLIETYAENPARREKRALRRVYSTKPSLRYTLSAASLVSLMSRSTYTRWAESSIRCRIRAVATPRPRCSGSVATDPISTCPGTPSGSPPMNQMRTTRCSTVPRRTPSRRRSGAHRGANTSWSAPVSVAIPAGWPSRSAR